MSRHPRLARLLGVLLLAPFVSLAARAAEPTPLPGVIGEKTLAVVTADFTRLNPAEARKSLAVLLGQMAGMTDRPLAMAQAFYDQLAKAGLQSGVGLLNWQGLKDATPEFYIYQILKDGSDPDALKKVITDLLPPEAASTVAFETSGKYLVAHMPGATLPADGAEGRAKLYAEALGEGKGAPLVMAFVPNDAWREMVRKEMPTGPRDVPPLLVEMAPEIIRVRWITASLTLGDAPSLQYLVQAADEASAQKLEQGTNKAIDQAKEMMAKKLRLNDDDAEGKKQVQSISAAMDQMRPKRDGARLALGLTTQGLKDYMNAIMVPSLARAQETANRVKCGINLSQMGKACFIYANDNNGKMPPDQGTMLTAADLSLGAFVCPTAQTQIPADVRAGKPEAQAAWVNANSDYVYLGGGLVVGQAVGADRLIAYEKHPHKGDGMNMLFGDGHVMYLKLAEAQKLIDAAKGK